jgi:hypothetical protein
MDNVQRNKIQKCNTPSSISFRCFRKYNDYINAYVGLFLKAQLESEDQEHKKQLDTLKCKHKEEIFTLKKDVYILNAKV